MKYTDLLQSSKDIRETRLTEECCRLGDTKAVIAGSKKHLAKVLVAMVAAGDCKSGDMRKHAEAITRRDIRREFQGVYETVAVFQAVVDKKIDMTEDEFDAADGSKIELLSPFLSKEELAPMLEEAVEKVKAGATAKEIRELKPKGDPKEPKAVKEMREKLEAKEKEFEDYKEMATRGTLVDVAFACTDIASDAPLLTSQQLRNRLRDDLIKAVTTLDEQTIRLYQAKMGAAFLQACHLLGEDPLDFIAAYSAEAAAPASAKVVEIAGKLEGAAA